jgi:hypothetical protein
MCNNSLVKPLNKYIKIYKEDFIAIEGSTTKNRLSLSDLKIPYEQYLYTEVMLEEDSYHHEIPYGALGDQITILIVKITYVPIQKTLTPDPEVPYLQYFFKTNENEIRNIDSLLILSGTKDKKLPKVYLNNPNKKYRAKVEVFAATQEVVFGTGITYVPISDTVVTIQDLEYTNIISDETGATIIVQIDNDNPIATIAIDRISNIEISGRLLIIDDTAIGKINLFFINEFHCLQAFSLINWAIKDPENNIITNTTGPDLISPIITYSPGFVTDISLIDYPVGTSGTAGYLITKQHLIDLLIDSVDDNRDGLILVDTSNITITKLNQSLKRENISEIGKYNFTIDILDTAGNLTSDSFILNITDNIPPQIILSTLGYELFENSTSGTGGTSGFVYQTDVFLQDFGMNIIDKQDLIDLLIAGVVDTADGTITANTNNIEVTITDFEGVTIIDEIDTAGYYDVYFQVVDSNNNVSTTLWKDIDTELFTTNVSIQIKENQPPEVNFVFPVPNISLLGQGGIVSKPVLQNVLIDNIMDDRDGIITSNILNISLFKTHYWDVSTSGTAGVIVIDGSNTYVFEPMPEVEMISTTTEGIYTIKVLVVDSDGALTLEEVTVNILS